MVSIAKGYGCDAAPLNDLEAIKGGGRGVEQIETDSAGDPDIWANTATDRMMAELALLSHAF